MALGDVVDGFDDDDDDDEVKGNKKQYVQPSKKEFEECLETLDPDFHIVDDDDSKELVYETDDIPKDTLFVSTRIFSTIDERTGKAREKGSDAIRTVLWHKLHDTVIGGRKKTLRIKTYCKNLRKKLVSLKDETDKYVTECNECGRFMVIREGEYGEFFGCLGYPKCQNTQQIEE